MLRQLFAVAHRARSTGSIFARETAAPVLLARAEWRRLLGVPDPGRWNRAARAWVDIGQPYPATYARYREAEAMLHRRESRAGATAVLREARDAAARLGAVPLLHEVEALAGRARLVLDPAGGPQEAAVVLANADPLTGYGLTRREREVLEHVARGRSDREIADSLFISDKTVSVHVSNIKGKLGVATRIQAATLALRLGAVGGDPSQHSAAENMTAPRTEAGVVVHPQHRG
jgi:DNA-binding CsgD family transcriptional regulator